MVLKIRFRLVGNRNSKNFSLVATDHRRTRNSGNFLEELAYKQKKISLLSTQGVKGDPMRKVYIDDAKIKKYLASPAKLSQTAHKFLSHAGYLPPLRYRAPPGFDRELWNKEYAKAKKYYLAKLKEE